MPSQYEQPTNNQEREQLIPLEVEGIRPLILSPWAASPESPISDLFRWIGSHCCFWSSNQSKKPAKENEPKSHQRASI